MEENIQINRLFKWLGICLCLVIVLVTIFSFISNYELPAHVLLSNIVMLVLFLPICILGHIPGQVLSKLPASLVKAIKLDLNNR